MSGTQDTPQSTVGIRDAMGVFAAARKAHISGAPLQQKGFHTVAPALLGGASTRLPWDDFVKLSLAALPDASRDSFVCLPEFVALYKSCHPAPPAGWNVGAAEVVAAVPVAPVIQHPGPGTDPDAMAEEPDPTERTPSAAGEPLGVADVGVGGADGGGGAEFDDEEVEQPKYIDDACMDGAELVAEADDDSIGDTNGGSDASEAEDESDCGQDDDPDSVPVQLGASNIFTGASVAGGVLTMAAADAQKALHPLIEKIYRDLLEHPENWEESTSTTNQGVEMILRPAVLVLIDKDGTLWMFSPDGDKAYFLDINIARSTETVIFSRDGTGALWTDNAHPFICRARELGKVRWFSLDPPNGDEFSKNRIWFMTACADHFITPVLRARLGLGVWYTPRKTLPHPEGDKPHRGHEIRSTKLLIKSLWPLKRGSVGVKRDHQPGPEGTPDGEAKAPRRAALDAARTTKLNLIKEEDSTVRSVDAKPAKPRGKNEPATLEAIEASRAARPGIYLGEVQLQVSPLEVEVRLPLWAKERASSLSFKADAREDLTLPAPAGAAWTFTAGAALRRLALYTETDEHAHKREKGIKEFSRMKYFALCEFVAGEPAACCAWIRVNPDGMIDTPESKALYNQAIHELRQVAADGVLDTMAVYFLFFPEDHKYVDHDDPDSLPYHVATFEEHTLPCGVQYRVKRAQVVRSETGAAIDIKWL